MKGQFRMSPRQTFDGGGYEAGRDRFGASDVQLARRRVGKEVDLVDALIDLIEDREAAPEQGASIKRRLCATLAAIQKLHPERLFQVGDCLGNDWLGDRKALGGLPHGAALGNSRQDFQLPQLESVLDLSRTRHVATSYLTRMSTLAKTTLDQQTIAQ